MLVHFSHDRWILTALLVSSGSMPLEISVLVLVGQLLLAAIDISILNGFFWFVSEIAGDIPVIGYWPFQVGKLTYSK